jgi:hypothetical protein
MPNEIYDLRKTKHFIIDHRIVDEYMPAIGGDAFLMYSIYCRMATHYSKVFPSFRTLRSFTGFGFTKIANCNKLLEEVGLVQIVREITEEAGKENNKYYLLEPKPLPESIKIKYYPKSWLPIFKRHGATNLGAGGATKSVTPPATNLGAGVLPKWEHNKDSVVVNNLT